MMNSGKTIVLSLALTVAIVGGGPLRAQDATLTILKEVSPVVDDTVFHFAVEGQGGTTPLQLMGDQSQEITLTSGSYVIREDVPEDWELSLIRCGDIYEVGPVASGALELALEPGASVLCRFDNTRLDVPPPPPPSVDVPVLSPIGLVATALTLSLVGTLLMRNEL